MVHAISHCICPRGRYDLGPAISARSLQTLRYGHSLRPVRSASEALAYSRAARWRRFRAANGSGSLQSHNPRIECSHRVAVGKSSLDQSFRRHLDRECRHSFRVLAVHSNQTSHRLGVGCDSFEFGHPRVVCFSNPLPKSKDPPKYASRFRRRRRPHCLFSDPLREIQDALRGDTDSDYLGLTQILGPAPDRETPS